MNLADTQALFWRAITWPTGVEDFLAQADPKTRASFAQTFAQTPTFSRTARVQVYAEAYFWRLFEVALDQYPILAWLAGQQRFHNLVTDFVLAHPSQSPDLRRFAATLPDFVGSHALQQHYPGLAEVAAIDAAIIAAVDRCDEARLDQAALHRIPARAWPNLRFELTNTAGLFCSPLPYSDLWSAHARGETAPAPSPTAVSPCTVLVWRQLDHDVYQRTLKPAEASALRALQRGANFTEICSASATPPGRAATPQQVVVWLNRWLSDGLLTAVCEPERG